MITVAEITSEAVAVMTAALTGAQVYDYFEIPENHTTVPALEVYPQEGAEEQYNFADMNRAWETIVHLDFYGAVRSNLPHDLEVTVPYIDTINAALRDWRQTLAGDDAIKSIEWKWSRIPFRRGQDVFAGLRWVVTFTGF